MSLLHQFQPATFTAIKIQPQYVLQAILNAFTTFTNFPRTKPVKHHTTKTTKLPVDSLHNIRFHKVFGVNRHRRQQLDAKTKTTQHTEFT